MIIIVLSIIIITIVILIHNGSSDNNDLKEGQNNRLEKKGSLTWKKNLSRVCQKI